MTESDYFHDQEPQVRYEQLAEWIKKQALEEDIRAEIEKEKQRKMVFRPEYYFLYKSLAQRWM